MIEFSHVGFSYDGRVPALEGVDATVAEGEFVCILGGNGSGKSTLARHINALLRPDAGTVRVCGLDTSDPELVYDIRSRAGMVFQNPDDQLVASIVEDDIAFGPENLGVPSAEIADRVKGALKEVGLVGYGRRETHALSGGQKQRVAIAGALAMEPRILILDEASSMLDPRGRAGLMRVAHELNARGMTIVMITHFMDEAAEADRVIVLDRGRVALSGTPQEVLTGPDELARLNLGMPAPCRLALALRERGVDVALHVDADGLCREVAAQYKDAGDAGRVPAAKPLGRDAVSEPVLELEHVSYSYERSVRERERKRRRHTVRPEQKPAWGTDPDAVWALRDVSFAVRQGEFLGIAGHTGSGKSTLIQHLNGLVEPTVGRVLLHGRDLADKHVSASAKGTVGVVAQYPERQLFAATVGEDVAFGPRNLRLAEPEVSRRVADALAAVGLDPEKLLDQSPFALSGGQQRLVAFAGVLAMEPEVLVLDEPTAGLDPVAHRSFLDLLRHLHGRGMTVVMVSHDMDDLAELCDRMVVLNEGRVFLEGAPATVFSHGEELRQAGLGVPSAQALAQGLVQAGVPLDAGNLYSIDSLADDVSRALGVGA